MSANKRAVLAGVVVLATTVPAVAGVMFRSETTSDDKRNAAATSVVKGWVSGDSGKVEFVESGNPMTAAGSYLITKDGGATVILVDPKEKTYMKWDMASVLGMAGGAVKMMNMKYSEPKVEVLSEAPGGLVAGLPTTHYKIRTSYTMEMKFMGMKKSSTVVTEEDIWATSELVERALGMWFKKEPPKTGDAEFDAFLAKQMHAVKGFPLKRVAVTTTTDEKGKRETSTMTMEVKELQAMPIPASTFEIPADYKETTLFGGEEGEGGNPFAKMLGGKKKP